MLWEAIFGHVVGVDCFNNVHRCLGEGEEGEFDMKMFKHLTEEEKKEYRQWVRDEYTPLTDIKGVWHPVAQAECVKMNEELVEEEGEEI